MAKKYRDWGRIRQLPSGRWQARYPGPDGILRPAPETFDTRKLAATWLSEKQTEIEQDEWTDPDEGKQPFMPYAYAWVRDRKLSDSTRDRYEGLLRNHFAPTFERHSVASPRPATIRAWRSGLLANGVGEPTVAKCYRLAHAIWATAANVDRIVKRNPCQIAGASEDNSPERVALTVDEVFRLADAMPARLRMLVLLAAFTSLRFGELAALRRRDVDKRHRDVHVRHSQSEVGDKLILKGTKSRAGVRVVAYPEVIAAEFDEHIARYSEPGPDGRIFVGPQGGYLRRRNVRRVFVKARSKAGLSDDVHFHDLRHTGNQLAAEGGATTKELMSRMGQSTSRAALIYQHATRKRDREIAEGMSRNIAAARRRPVGKRARKRAGSKRKGHEGGTGRETAA
ncbi:tyrosine-type recombinase/integrase [Amycolatopsis nivea]